MPSVFQKHVALPHEHGAWVFLLSPLTIGLYAGGTFSRDSVLLVVAALGAFLLRQPMSMAVKVLAGRRGTQDRAPAFFWAILYGAAAIAATTLLVRDGFGMVLYLAAPAIPVMSWHLWLVSRRKERRQQLIEILGAGALALSAPAAYWVGQGKYEPIGWSLWALTWLQSGASIVYAYLRLAQRDWKAPVPAAELLGRGRPAVTFSLINVVSALGFGVALRELRFVFLPYLLQFAEVVWGTLRPAIAWKPTRVGIRQLIVSTIWTVLLIIVYNR